MRTDEQKAIEVRGLYLMAQRGNLIYLAAHAETPEEQTKAIDALEAWHKAMTDADWNAFIAAEYGTGRAGRRALVAHEVARDTVVHRQDKIEEWPAAL